MKKKKINNSLTVSYILKNNILNRKVINNLKSNLNSFFSKSKYPNGPVHAEVIINKKNKKFLLWKAILEKEVLMYITNCVKKLLD